jgi:hypothetical protein
VLLMVGSQGERMLQITLPHVEWRKEGFAKRNVRVSQRRSERGATRAAIGRSACVLSSWRYGRSRPHTDEDVALVTPGEDRPGDPRQLKRIDARF